MTFNQLTYFCAVCRYESISRAAAELYVSQPTISVALRSLENEFGLQLFHHGKNQIKLTVAGESFYRRVQVLLKEFEDFHTEFSLLGQNSYTVKVGVPPLLSATFITELSSEFERHSDIPVRLYEYGSERACNLVENETLDVAIVNLEICSATKFGCHVMAQYYSTYCVHKSHPLAHEKSISMDMIADEPIIMFNTDSIHNKTIMTRYSLLGKVPNIIMFASQLPTISKMLRSRRCGFFVYNSVPLDEDEFVKLPLTPPITTKVGIAWKNGIYLNDYVLRFIDFAKKFKLKKDATEI